MEPREELRHSLRISSVSEVYINVIQDVHDGYLTAVWSAVRTTEKFSVKADLYQGSVLGSFFFAILIERAERIFARQYDNPLKI